MEKFLENLKEELDEISDIQPTITVKRSDLESLIRAYEKLKTDLKSDDNNSL